MIILGVFKLQLDEELTDFFFIKDKKANLTKIENNFLDDDDKEMIRKKEFYLKKNYLMITTKGKVKYKNLIVKKKSTSTLTRKIFFDILVPKIAQEHRMKFSESYISFLVNDLLSKDISLATFRYAVKPTNVYKNDSQLQAQISKIYGPGIHFMIPISKEVYDENHNILTAGKDKKYISIENFEKYKLKITDINLENVWAELAYFIKDSQSTLSSFFA